MKKINSLRFGTAGIPNALTSGDTGDGVAMVRTLGLDAMELEFVRSVNISEQKAPRVREMASKNDIALTCHGSYFINLNAVEQEKQDASIGRILSAARRAKECGAWSLCFHAGFYMKQEPDKVYTKIKKAMKKILKTLKDESNPIWLRPETTGKPTQFGNLRELLTMSSELEQVLPVIDFSHLHARSNGLYNTKKEFKQILSDVEKHLGKEGLQNMHAHVAGIAYGEKGEKHHLNLKESDFNYVDLMKTLKEFKVKGVLICESPNIEEDALLMKKTFEGS